MTQNHQALIYPRVVLDPLETRFVFCNVFLDLHVHAISDTMMFRMSNPTLPVNQRMQPF